MNNQMALSHRQESTLEDGMLFVRTEGILRTMAKAPILLVGIIIMAVVIPLQTSFSTTRSLDLIIYPDGSTHISSELEVNSFEPDFTVNLFGSSIDNFVAVGENDFILSAELTDENALLETLGSTTISIEYDIHDLVSKEGRIWTFSIDAPADYTLLMPQNSIIVGMDTLPLNMEIIGEQTRLLLPSGSSEINYVFGTVTPPPITTPPNSDFDSFMLLVGGIVAAAGVLGAILLRRSQKKPEKTQRQIITGTGSPLDPDTIFKLRPDLREDDKELINFISSNGGKALESELRKKFLQPRTTMWRAVKRLERQGIIEIEKKELQNLVKLKSELEGEL
jgi:uncharacterized membrane protein